MKEEIKKILIDAIIKAGYNVPVGFSVENPPNDEMGDWASNVAMMISKGAGDLPKDCAGKIVKNISSEIIQKAEVAGPGFINIYLIQDYLYQQLYELLLQGNTFGNNEDGKGKTVNVEFISANPTGPVHIGNARGGPIGEAIANLFDFCGYKVIRSFYVNDIGGQINKLAASFYYWYEKINGQNPIFPDGGYPGEYIEEITRSVTQEFSKDLKNIKDESEFLAFFKDKGVKAMVKRIKAEAHLLGIDFDDFIFQSALESSGKTAEIIEYLTNNDKTTLREGALWFKNDVDVNYEDKESVLQKSDGKKTLTYFADDIACHKYKIDQGANIMIDIWGAGHHGHIARMKAAMQAININPEKLQIILYQNVRIKNGDEIMKMSKREGNFVLLSDVLKHGVGPDVFKYFILSQNNNTPLDFDVKLAMDKSEKNPVYYVQYAYARICSIIKKAGGVKGDKGNLRVLKHPREIALIKELLMFPDIVDQAHNDYQMQVFPHYAHKLAGLFHEFYNDCHVIGEKKELEKARLALVNATKIVLYNVLKICDISAPEKM